MFRDPKQGIGAGIRANRNRPFALQRKFIEIDLRQMDDCYSPNQPNGATARVVPTESRFEDVLTELDRPRPHPIKGRHGRALLGALLALVCLAAPASALAQGGNVKATHGAWQVNCGKPPGSAQERCALVQSVTAEDRPNVGLTVILLKTVDGKRRLLRVVAPLGVLLPTGLGLKIDDKDVGNAPFLKCGKVGCIAEVVLQDDLVKKFQAGSTAMFIIFQTPEAGIGIPISLNGFASALTSIK